MPEMFSASPQIKWNPKVKIIISDVDETIADLFMPATSEMISELNMLLSEGVALFLVSGAGFTSIKSRIIDFIKPELRKYILVSHCSGAEVKGFSNDGRGEIVHYSLYDKTLSKEQKDKWRKIVGSVISEFHLDIHPNMPVKNFKDSISLVAYCLMPNHFHLMIEQTEIMDSDL